MDKINLKNCNIIILAAGIGSRIGLAGKKIPKSLFKINKKRVIDYLIELLIKKKAKRISIMTGYKSMLIKKYLKKYNNVEITYKDIKDYSKNGHGYTWYKYKHLWENSKKTTFLFHADILFSEKYLDNMIKSNKKDIIGIKDSSKKLSKEIFYVSTRKSYVEKISKMPTIKKLNKEIIGINKISYKLMKKIFLFMDNYFQGKNKKKLSWELVIDEFIQKNPNSFQVLNNQVYPWININRVSDFNKAKKIFKI